ncbi:hypothetical protein BDZ89DRAFT_1155147 [Hymenopellis radicata]|nr:hypothetical protein BDZ89DRAFT_1155147 [Hymenopellis radicata]
MSLLHVHFALRNQQAFQRLLDAINDRTVGISSSGGKSWSKGGIAVAAEINRRDTLGRTVLHLASSSADALEYVRLLLRHPAIDVNAQDLENRWTPLHRALYDGNVAAAILLLERSDIDVTLKDAEGYTAFELYNSTIEGTKPESAARAELFTWGANRNATLGLGDGDDRTYPEQVLIPHRDTTEQSSISTRFLPLQIQQIQTSKLHTVVVTSEKRANLRVCGFGSGGRLGPGQHTQYSMTPLAQLSQTIVSVALGQDHTLALTDTGEVLSWGLNRFAQLGYVVETSTMGRIEEPVQVSAKKIVGPLKKEFVQGVAACKTASACWTSTEVFTWGTNHGQLGYDKSAQPIQILPRRVTKITKPIISLCLTDSALVCLLNTQEVICIWSDRSFKLNFPSHGFPHEIQPYRPPQAVKGAHISKVTCCEETIAALSSNGEVFTFTVPSPVDSDNPTFSAKGFTPQPAWTLKKQLSAAKDVAVGNDGTIVVCTQSGHVFVRTRKGGISTKALKYQAVPYLQRVVEVCSNSTGAFGALRADFSPRRIELCGNTIAQDLATVFPPLAPSQSHNASSSSVLPGPVGGDDDDECDAHLADDLRRLLSLSGVLTSRKGPISSWYLEGSARLPHGADMMVLVQSSKQYLPVHSTILAARSTHLHSVLHGGPAIQDATSKLALRVVTTSGHRCLIVTHCHPMTVLILLYYLYSDRVLAIWDRRLSLPQFDCNRIKSDLQLLARLLDISALSKVLHSATKMVPEPTMVKDMSALFLVSSHPDADVILQFQDQDVYCHSVILRSRTIFFADFFNEEDWTKKRRDAKGVIKVNMKHMKWHVMQYVLRFMCCGEDMEMFKTLDFTRTVDDVLDFMFDIMAAATELHLDRLTLIASSIVLRFLNIHNGSYILSEATHYSALPLVRSVQEYLAVNLESLLESRMLDHLHPAVIKQLAKFISLMQADKSPTVRNNVLGRLALDKHADWLALQDFPAPIVRSAKELRRRDSMKLSPPSPTAKSRPSRPVKTASSASPILTPQVLHDDIFSMDEEEAEPLQDLHRSPPWKAPSAPRVDMRAVMAETASTQAIPPPGDHQITKRISSSTLQSTSPWRIPQPTATPSRSPAQFPTLSASPQGPSTPTSRPPGRKPGVNNSPSTHGPGLGPVFSPARQAPSGSKAKPASSRSISSSQKAWTLPPSQPVAPTPSGVALSFAEIQQSQQVIPTETARRSLLEIQEEEQARLAEEAFMKWWAAEEERVRIEAEQEAEALRASQIPGSNPKGRGGRNQGRGRGRGMRKKGNHAPSNP